MQEDKITFSAAAKLAGVHFNTLRNWRGSGRLKTASKDIIDGVPTWVVALQEVKELAAKSKVRKSQKPKQQSNVVDVPSINSTPPKAPQRALTAQDESSLIIFRDIIFKLQSEKDNLIRENEQ